MLYISKLFLCFILFSFLGWILEVIYGVYIHKKFINRGFLIGPLCPLYGCGCVSLYLLLKSYADDPLMLFLASMVVCSIIEYFASYVMEKIFKTRWWDYRDKKFNINGRICLEMIVPFGLLGLGVVYILFPFVLNCLDRVPNIGIYIVTVVLLLIFIVDLIVSFNVIMKFSKTALMTPVDMTQEITKFVRDTLKNQKLTKRLIDTFPNFKIDLGAIKNIKDKLLKNDKEKTK